MWNNSNAKTNRLWNNKNVTNNGRLFRATNKNYLTKGSRLRIQTPVDLARLNILTLWELKLRTGLTAQIKNNFF